VLTLDSDAAAAIRAHAADAYPHECCGALVGAAGTGEIRVALPLPNTTSEGPRRRFMIQPQDYLAAERFASDRGLALLGFYHSHPDHPARPSQHDLDHAWPNLDYVIVSVRDGAPREMTCWRLEPDRAAFAEVAIASASRVP
jgi:proteasome lid subunit RPN8/RPN11